MGSCVRRLCGMYELRNKASSETLPATVVVCTIGRLSLLEACLESIVACQPRPREIVVVDQSGDPSIKELVARHHDCGARWIQCRKQGVAAARNTGLSSTKYDVLLFTDDDCTVARDWIQHAYDYIQRQPDAILTGRVRAPEGANGVPSTIESRVPRRLTASKDFAVLYTGNMAVSRSSLHAIGAFDERIRPAASDNDLCYRWLKADLPMFYEPGLVVWHHDWRSRDQLTRRYTEYGIGQGMFYAKHLRAGDWSIARYLARDFRTGVRGFAARLLRGPAAEPDYRPGLLVGMPVGLLRGWRTFRRAKISEPEGPGERQ